jgi:hypothetical protein
MGSFCCRQRGSLVVAIRAYAKRALMKIPSLEDYEQRAAKPAVPADKPERI